MYTFEELTPMSNIKGDVLCGFFSQAAQGKKKKKEEKKKKLKKKKLKKRKDRAELFRPKHRVKPRVLHSLEELL